MMVMTDDDGVPAEPVGRDDRPGPAKVSGRQLRELLADDLWLDALIGRAEEGGVRLTGDGGFLPELVKAVLEPGDGRGADRAPRVANSVGNSFRKR